MAFTVGQKVECIDDRPVSLTRTPVPFRLGGIYTISDIRGEFVGISDVTPTGGWYATRFRPVVSRTTDISVFTRMLTPAEPETVA